MKKIGFILGAVLFLATSAMASSGLNQMSGYFVKKSLNDEAIKALLQNSNGENVPVIITENNKRNAHDYPNQNDVNVESLDVYQDADGVTHAYLVYSLNGKYQVSETFSSTDLKSWVAEGKTIRIVDEN